MVAYSNKVVEFDGTNEYVTMGDVLGFERTSPQSYSCWMKLNASSTRMLLSKATGSTTYRGVHLYGSNGSLIFMLCNDAAVNNRIQIGTTATFNDNNYHHVVATYDGSSTAAGCKIYVDNVLQTVTVYWDALSATILTTAAFMLGSRGPLDAFFSGRLDEVAVYSKALSTTEIAWIYNSGVPRDLYASGSPSGLLAWWRMGEGDLASSLILLDSGPSAAPNMVRDLSGNSYHGTMTNMESSDVVLDSPGAPRSALFDGVNEFVTVGDVLGFERTDSFSFSFWFKWSAGASGMIISKAMGASTYRGYQITKDTTGYLSFWLLSDYGSGNFIELRTTTTYNDSTWHHCVMTYGGGSAAASMKIYVDGAQVTATASVDNLTGTILNSVDFMLGGRSDGFYYYPGQLDEVAVYTAVLSASEVSWLYNSGVPRSLLDGGAPSNLAAWWKMGDGDTYPTLKDSVWANPHPTIYDASGKGHDGTMTNMSSGDIVTTTPGGVSTRACNFAGGVAKSVRVATFPTWSYTSPFSVSFWVKTSNSTSSGAWRRYGDGSNYVTVQFDGTNQITFIVAFNGTGLTLITDYYPLRDGNWHHVVVSYNGSATGTGQAIFVDGNLAPNWGYDADTLTAGTISTMLEFVNYDLNGIMDEGAVYSKALSLAEVQWIYNSGAPRMLNASGAPTGLAGWWRMGEDGYGKYGTMTNMEVVDLVGDSPGYWAFDMRSLLFDGADEYVAVGNVLAYERTQTFTISAWIRTTATGSPHSIVAKLGDAPTSTGYDFQLDSGGGLELILSSNAGGGNWIVKYTGSVSVADGVWHQVAVSFAGTSLASGIKFYIDGAEWATTGVSVDALTTSMVSSDPLWLGARYQSIQRQYFNGNLDEIAVYSRVLTATEIAWLYNSGMPRNLKDTEAPANLVAYWRMSANAYPGAMTSMESTDILSDSPAGLGGSLFDIFPYWSEQVGSVRDGNVYLLGGGGGGITYYKLRVRDDGAGPPAVYREWESTDFNSTPPPPSPIGSWVERTVLAQWEV